MAETKTRRRSNVSWGRGENEENKKEERRGEERMKRIERRRMGRGENEENKKEEGRG